MTKLDARSPSLMYPSASSFDPGRTRRLIVLVPADAGLTAAAQRVWELANAFESRVHFLGLCEDAAQESSLRRQLVTMSAMVQDDKVQSEIRIERGSDWVSAIRSQLQKGDMIVCFSGQRTGVLRRPLSKVLESHLSAPIYIISGQSSRNRARPHWPLQVVMWTGFSGIIAGATLLQIRLVALPNDWIQSTLMVISVIAEAWSIWIWNGLFD
jgi:hypothetical protein